MSLFAPFFSEYPNQWICTVCHEDQKDGVVAHSGRDGEKHPLHLECIIQWRKHSILCPACGVETALPLEMSRVSVEAERAIRSYSIWSRINRAAFQLKLGLSFLLMGQILKSRPCSLFGSALEAYAVHRAVRYGSARILVARRIEVLCKELMLKFSNETFNEIIYCAESVPKYREMILPWHGNHDQKMVLKRIEALSVRMHLEILGDQAVRFYRMCMLLGALYHGARLWINYARR